MKKSIVVVTLVIASLISLNISAEDKSQFFVGVDPRVELLSTVEIISDWSTEAAFMFNKLDFDYKNKLIETFSKHKDHKIIKIFNSFLTDYEDFVINVPVDIILHFGPPPGMEPIAKIPDDLAEYVGGEDKIQEFMAAMRDFAVETDYMGFFNSFESTFKIMRDHAIESLEGVTPEFVENYYGMKQNSYNLVLAPIAGGFGPRVERDNGKLDCFALIPASHLVGGIPVSGTRGGITFYLTHEFSHSFVNPVVEANQEEVMKYEALFEPIREKMSQQRYRSWIAAVCEHLVRAAEIRLTEFRLGEERAKKWMDRQIAMGYDYIDELVSALKEKYEPNRDRFPTFESFFPELLKVFDEAMTQLQDK